MVQPEIEPWEYRRDVRLQALAVRIRALHVRRAAQRTHAQACLVADLLTWETELRAEGPAAASGRGEGADDPARLR